MLKGTITAFENGGQFGVIDADDGEMLVFNLHGIDAALREHFRCGTRVGFIERLDASAPRALGLTILQPGASDI